MVGRTNAMGEVLEDYTGVTVDARAVTSDDTYTYFSIPAEGKYDETSKIRTENSNLDKYDILIKNADIEQASRQGGYCTNANVEIAKNSALTGVIFTFPRKVSKFVFFYINVSGNPWYLNGTKLSGTSVDGTYYRGEITFTPTASVTIKQTTASNAMQINGQFE